MAQASQSRSTKSANDKKGRRGGGFWLLVALITPVGLFALPTTVLFLAGMVPTWVAVLIDRDPEKTAGITVGAMNICGVLPFLMDLWKHHQTMAAATKTLSDPLAWLVMFGAAGVGWILYFMIPPIVVNFEVFRSESRISSLQNNKRELIEEWGPEVAMDDETLLAARHSGTAAKN